jgi:hypothetical protein
VSHMHTSRSGKLSGEWIDKVTYPRLPAKCDEELTCFFEQATFARLGTLNEGGTIYITPVFFMDE